MPPMPGGKEHSGGWRNCSGENESPGSWGCAGLEESRADLHNHLLILTFTWPNGRETLASVKTRVRVCHGLLPSRLPRGELFDKNEGRGSRVRGLLREKTCIPQTCDAVFPYLPAILPYLASDVCNSPRTPFFAPQAVNSRACYGSPEHMGAKLVQHTTMYRDLFTNPYISQDVAFVQMKYQKSFTREGGRRRNHKPAPQSIHGRVV
ncbi:hypothetical protein LZ31DRAFT_233106 [Colletotrichum somersetense]|nr:hypothetical protein LZ31DRAFT_233106 [Colletotrichum somersetense]